MARRGPWHGKIQSGREERGGAPYDSDEPLTLAAHHCVEAIYRSRPISIIHDGLLEKCRLGFGPKGRVVEKNARRQRTNLLKKRLSSGDIRRKPQLQEKSDEIAGRSVQCPVSFQACGVCSTGPITSRNALSERASTE
jgi:hypothetical protein